jgi:hypothetical protein
MDERPYHILVRFGADVMAIHLASFGTLRFRALSNYMRVDGPPLILDALKEYLRSRGVQCKLKRDTPDCTILLKIRSGPRPEHVQELLDEWTR